MSLHRPMPPGFRTGNSSARVVCATSAPCGCNLLFRDDGTIHLHPCEDRCPSGDALLKAVRDQIPGIKTTDLRTEPN